MTSVGFIKNILPSGGRGTDKNIFSKVKMIVFDEADDIFANSLNIPAINSLIMTHIKVGLGINPQYVLFSATMDQPVIDIIE